MAGTYEAIGGETQRSGEETEAGEAKAREKEMKKLAWLLIIFVLSGCGMSLNQLEAEKAYYQMLQATKSVAQQPLVDIKISDPTKPINIERITVFAPPSDKGPSQYVQTNYDAAAWQFLGTAVSVAAPWVGAVSIVRAVSDLTAAGTTTYNQNVSGTGNAATVKTAGNTAVSGGITGNGNAISGLNDQTSPPTVVNQPAPVVVTQPDPVIVNQPAPIVVPQPAPVIVNPVIVSTP